MRLFFRKICKIKEFKSIHFKLIVAASVIVGLIYFNKLNFASVPILEARWPWLLFAFFLTLPPFLIVSCRFRIVLSSQNIAVPYSLALKWTMIGSFFDLIMPSSNGGDLIKSAYVTNYVGAGLRMSGIMAVAFDRVIGLLGLFLLTSLISILGWPYMGDIGSKNEIIGFSLLMGLGPLIFFRILGSNAIYRNPKIICFLSSNKIGQRVLQFIGSFNALRKHPKFLVIAIALSILNHIFWCISLLAISYSLGQEIDPLKGLIVFPVVIFCGVFGVAGGFGVGTLAFQYILSKTLLIDNGAVIGIIFQTLGLLSRLFGLPFYLLNKSSFPKNNIRVLGS